jgi:hypothetical protein
VGEYVPPRAQRHQRALLAAGMLGVVVVPVYIQCASRRRYARGGSSASVYTVRFSPQVC